MYLLPPNATEAERAMSGSIARISEIPVNIGDSWNPLTCPSNLLPWLAFAFSVDGWNSDLPDYIKRDLIANAVYVHKHKGTLAAVRSAISSFGIGCVLTEWFNASLDPYTFNLTFSDSLVSNELRSKLIAAVNAVKPVRSSISTTIVYGYNTGLNVTASSYFTNFDRIEGVCQVSLT